ncbi:DUF5007 domain-containing protein [Pedobacter endophyticus]|uniref:DUF5007 domain-containing protein n=1 Tax=Pedobacter endophyticus TaxID=2789740 RepID=A0A7U3Q5V1_9SPHI|nr:DUF5007 domain-containing protein [Pedobacter endophyticus]QPH38879.1 DUF5007 domain-containing protein [Pedobacter endophyticus]
MNNKTYLSLAGFMVFNILMITACKKNLPKERLSLGSDSQFTTTQYQPVLGRNNLFSDNFFIGSSSVPLDFKIVNMRRFNGEPAPELTEYFPVQVWKTAYDGTEKSIAEIEAKRTTENHQLFEIRQHSGQFLMWSKANSNFVKAQPDSGYVFDVEVSNSGGRKYFKNFKLRPYKERAYEPSNLNAVTGQATTTGISPSIMSNIRGEKTGRYLFGSSDVEVQFKKNNASGNSLSFKFIDTLQQTIDPNMFAKTDWENLVHGFNMVKNSDSVKYDVAYPIPLASYQTKYTTGGGRQASAIFRYERQGFGNIQERALIGLNFSLFEPGNWTIIFWFKTERPKFTNE